MTKRIVFQTENSIGHIDVPEDAEVSMQAPKHIEPPLLNPDINATVKGESNVFDEIKNAIHLALLKHSRAFAHIHFELQEVTRDGFFIYNHTPIATGYTTTFKARWYYISGEVTIDFTGQTIMQTNKSTEEPPLGMNK